MNIRWCHRVDIVLLLWMPPSPDKGSQGCISVFLHPHCLVRSKHSIPFISNTNELSKLCLGGAFNFFVCMGVVSWSKSWSLHMLTSSVPLSYIPRPSKWLLLRLAEGCRNGCRAWRGPEISFQDPRGQLTTSCNSCSRGLWQPLLASSRACILTHVPSHIHIFKINKINPLIRKI